MNPFLKYVNDINSIINEAETIKLSNSIQPKKYTISENKPPVVIFSPHPDDESIIGSLPVRLLRDSGRRIINVAVTFGSNISRRPGRLTELTSACNYLNFDIEYKSDFSDMSIPDINEILIKYKPDIIFIPHEKDANYRHIIVHKLVISALEQLEDFSCTIIENEYWSPIESPNIMIEVSNEILADMIAATSLHEQEIKRNPYHLTLPAWMIDNVRRGSEIINGAGSNSINFKYATLYRRLLWRSMPINITTSLILSMEDDPESIILSI